jgi:hypothetical protein
MLVHCFFVFFIFIFTVFWASSSLKYLFKIPLSSPFSISISFCFFLFALFILFLSAYVPFSFFLSVTTSLVFSCYLYAHLFTSIAYLIEPKHPLPLFFHVLSFEIAFRQYDWLHNQTNLVSFQTLTCDVLLQFDSNLKYFVKEFFLLFCKIVFVYLTIRFSKCFNSLFISIEFQLVCSKYSMKIFFITYLVPEHTIKRSFKRSLQ